MPYFAKYFAKDSKPTLISEEWKKFVMKRWTNSVLSFMRHICGKSRFLNNDLECTLMQTWKSTYTSRILRIKNEKFPGYCFYMNQTYNLISESVLVSDVNLLRDCNGTWSLKHLVRKRTLNHLSKLAKWLDCAVIDYLYGALTVYFIMLRTCLEWIYTLRLLECQGTSCS